MLISPNSKYIPDLMSLWHESFGDEEEYINLFFSSVYNKSKVFAFFDEDKIVSVLYLLNCSVKLSGKTYDGYYLYAASTAEKYRSKGYMGELIRQAQKFALNSGKDYISLVPGTDSLYRYYERFGFVTSMYKFIKEYNSENNTNDSIISADASSYIGARELFKDNYFIWHDDEMSYAFDCFHYSDAKAVILENGAMIYSEKDRVIYELVSAKDCYNKILKEALSCFSNGKVRVCSPYDGKKIPFGMIYPINDEMNTGGEIYMNLALD